MSKSAQSQQRILLVDVGNTSAAMALARGSQIGRTRRLAPLPAGCSELRAGLQRLLGNRPADGAVYASVVPAADRQWMADLQAVTRTPPLSVNHRLDLGVRLDYPRPQSIGADRLANASAAQARYGSPVIVADFGTALTVDVIAERAYLGGLILPGPSLMTDYLAERTALLPLVRFGRGKAAGGQGSSSIGKSTRQAISLGARLGYAGMLREVYNRLRSELQSPALPLVATGGYASWALAGTGLPAIIDPDLTLFGLLHIFQLNRKGPQ